VAAGYFGGAVSWIVTSLADLIFAVPSVLLALAIVSGLGPGWQNTAIAVGISYTPIFIRVVRGPVLTLRRIVRTNREMLRTVEARFTDRPGRCSSAFGVNQQPTWGVCLTKRPV
jgi:hypothetical protein